MDVVDAVVVGGGIAGLSAAHALLSAGVRRVRVIERESIPCAHSSGRNAAIFRRLSSTPGDFALAHRSCAILDELCSGEARWLRRTGLWFASADAKEIERYAEIAARDGITHERASGSLLVDAAPSLAGGAMTHGLFCADDGVIDIHAVTQALLRSIASRGGQISYDGEVARIEREGDRVTAVSLSSGERVAAGAVVIAAGAWAGPLGAAIGAPMPLEPRRRHLAQLDTRQMDASAAVVWCLGSEVYYRPESGGVLASPCDEHAWRAELPPPDENAIELLAQKLAHAAPRIADAAVRRAWACLRTFAPDRVAIVGKDPRVHGLHWIAGLGGHGMTGGAAAGEVIAASVTGRSDPLLEALDPARALRAG